MTGNNHETFKTLAEILDEPKAPTIDGEDAAKETRRAHLECLAREGRLMRGFQPNNQGSTWLRRVRRTLSVIGRDQAPKTNSDLTIIIDSKTVIPATKKP